MIDDANEMKALKDRLAAASPGPWKDTWDEVANELGETETIVSADGKMVFGLVWYNGLHASCRKEDSAFIAHARTDIPMLIEKIAALKAERTKLCLEQLVLITESFGGYDEIECPKDGHAARCKAASDRVMNEHAEILKMLADK